MAEGNESCYLIMEDYFSRYPEVIKLRTTTSGSIIEASKAVFSRHIIPETVLSNNDPQFSSKEFAKFAADYSIVLAVHTPLRAMAFPNVQIVKSLLKVSSDPYLAILTWCNLSPAQLLMGRQLTSNPTTTQNELQSLIN